MIVKWLCDCTVESLLLIWKMSRLNLGLRSHSKVLWKIKPNVFFTGSIFHQPKKIRTVINIAPILFVFFAPILDKTHKMLYWIYVTYASSSFVPNMFLFFSDVEHIVISLSSFLLSESDQYSQSRNCVMANPRIHGRY